MIAKLTVKLMKVVKKRERKGKKSKRENEGCVNFTNNFLVK